MQNIARFHQRRALGSRYQTILGHQVVHFSGTIRFETQVAVGQDTNQPSVGVGDRDATDAVFFHQIERFGDHGFRVQGDGIDDHACFRTFHGAYLIGLVGNAHVLVDHADTTLSGDSDSQVFIRHSVHGSRNDRDIQTDFAGELCGNIDFSGKDFTVSRDEQNVVVSEGFAQKFGRGGGCKV